MDTIFYGIAHLCGVIFKVIPKLGNIPNIFLAVCGISGFVIWTCMLIKYRRQGGNE